MEAEVSDFGLQRLKKEYALQRCGLGESIAIQASFVLAERGSPGRRRENGGLSNRRAAFLFDSFVLFSKARNRVSDD